MSVTRVGSYPEDRGPRLPHLFRGGDPPLLIRFLRGFGEPLAQSWPSGGHSGEGPTVVFAISRHGSV